MNKDLAHEIKALNKLQRMQADELIELTDEATYPEKIKQLLEEIKFAKEKQQEL